MAELTPIQPQFFKDAVDPYNPTPEEIFTAQEMNDAIVSTINDLVENVKVDSNQGVVSFKSLNTFVNTPQSPLTVPITFDMDKAVNGAVTCVYYKAASLDIVKIEANYIENTEAFTPDELCQVFFMYDKSTNTMMVNVQKGKYTYENGGLPYDLPFEL